jgi:hypothetical protein
MSYTSPPRRADDARLSNPPRGRVRGAKSGASRLGDASARAARSLHPSPESLALEPRSEEEKPPRHPFFNPFLIVGSESATRLVADITGRLQVREQTRGLRRRARRPVDERNYRMAVDAVVSNVVSVHLREPGRWLAIPLSKRTLARRNRYVRL